MYLRAVRFNILKDASLSDVRQAPAAAATIKAYLQSGVVEIGTTVAVTPTVVTLLGPGRIEAGDTVWLNGDSTAHMTCTSVSSTSITLNSTTGSEILVSELDRLVPTTRRPVLYQDPFGTTPVDPTNSQIVIDSSGEGVFYCPETLIDIQISGTGLVTEWNWDIEAGEISQNFPVINVNAFLGEDDPIQAAIDSTPDGGARVIVPEGEWERTTTLYMPCDRPLILEGEGAWDAISPYRGTRIIWTTNVSMLAIRGNFQEVRNMYLGNTSGGVAAAEKEGYGIRIGRREMTDPHPMPGQDAVTETVQGGSRTIRNVLIENVVVHNSPGWGIYIPGYGTQSDMVTAEEDTNLNHAFWIDLKRVYTNGAMKYGGMFVGGGVTTVTCDACKFMHNGYGDTSGTGATLDAYYVFLSGCVGTRFVNNTTLEGFSPDTKAWLALFNTEDTQIDEVWFEDDRTSAVGSKDPTYYVDILGTVNRGGSLTRSHFYRNSGSNGYFRIFRQATPLQNFTIGPNYGAHAGATHTAAAYPSGSYTDTAMFSLTTGTAKWVNIVNSGSYYDQTRSEHYPFTWTGIAGASISGYFYDVFKLPFSGGGNPSSATIGGQLNGALVLDNQYRGQAGQGQLIYWWGGTNPGWKATNNVPFVTNGERALWTNCVPGDLAWVTDAGPRLEICTVGGSPGTWVAA